MRIKLDENLSQDLAGLLRDAGHDVATVRTQNLSGSPDNILAAACQRERRCLVTADLDFGRIVDFPPERYDGIIVLRHPRPTLSGITALIHQVVEAVATRDPTGQLWIVEPGFVRIHEPGE